MAHSKYTQANVYTTGQKIVNTQERLHVAYKYWTVCIIISVLLG